MFLVETPDRILCHFEPIDIENEEFLFWDADGKSVRVSVAGKALSEIVYGEPRGRETGLQPQRAMPLSEAFERHAQAFHLNVDTSGSAEEVWCRLKNAEARLPRRLGLLSRLFRKGEQ